MAVSNGKLTSREGLLGFGLSCHLFQASALTCAGGSSGSLPVREWSTDGYVPARSASWTAWALWECPAGAGEGWGRGGQAECLGVTIDWNPFHPQTHRRITIIGRPEVANERVRQVLTVRLNGGEHLKFKPEQHSNGHQSDSRTILA